MLTPAPAAPETREPWTSPLGRPPAWGPTTSKSASSSAITPESTCPLTHRALHLKAQRFRDFSLSTNSNSMLVRLYYVISQGQKRSALVPFLLLGSTCFSTMCHALIIPGLSLHLKVFCFHYASHSLIEIQIQSHNIQTLQRILDSTGMQYPKAQKGETRSVMVYFSFVCAHFMYAMFSCCFNSRAPRGCLQYFTGEMGIISSYNQAGGQQLASQSYSYCIRPEMGILKSVDFFWTT